MSNNEKKMIDPADVQALLEAYDSTDQGHSQFGNLVNGLRNLMPRDYPEDMFGRWAEHPEYGRVLVCHSKPDNDGEVAIRFRDDGERTGVSQKWVAYTTLSFPEQHPHTLTTLEDTLEDYASAPIGTVVAIDGNYAWTKTGPDRWCSPDSVVCDADMACDMACGADKVLRLGWGQ